MKTNQVQVQAQLMVWGMYHRKIDAWVVSMTIMDGAYFSSVSSGGAGYVRPASVMYDRMIASPTEGKYRIRDEEAFFVGTHHSQ